MYYVGVDGGGTKTLFVLYNESGVELKRHLEGTCHFAQVGYDGLKKVIASGIETILTGIKDEKVIIGLGLAGYGRESSVRKNIEENLSEVLTGCEWYVTSDSEIALIGALNLQPGILVIAGTGSIAMAHLGEKMFRAGGWGYMIGDEGSAYWIAKKVLEAFSKQSDGRMEKTKLYDLIKEDLHLENDADVISFVLAHSKREEIAAFALYGYEAAKCQDKVALEIYEQASVEIALMINTLAKQFPTQQVLASYAGGVFKAKELMLPMIQSYLNEKVCLVDPIYPSEYGAYLYAKEKRTFQK